MLLSVCIPTCNRASFLRFSARCWLEQIAPFADRVELIIADNASDDDTIAMLEGYRGLGPFRLIQRPENIGFNRSTFDLVAEQAKGECVWVCGDDDYLNRDALAEVVAAIEGHPGQDHFYVTTQFVPADHAPNLAAEDPRDSAYISRPAGDGRGGVVGRTQKILETEAGVFSGFYSSIWRRRLAIQALSGEFRTHEPFTSLEATLPYSVFIARHRLAEPCYRIQPAILTVVHTISWPHYASLFQLKILPDLYHLYAVAGISRDVLRRHEGELLDHWPRPFIDLMHRRKSAPNSDFSFSRFLLRHGFELRFWKELFRYLWCDLLP